MYLATYEPDGLTAPPWPCHRKPRFIREKGSSRRVKEIVLAVYDSFRYPGLPGLRGLSSHPRLVASPPFVPVLGQKTAANSICRWVDRVLVGEIGLCLRGGSVNSSQTERYSRTPRGFPDKRPANPRNPGHHSVILKLPIGSSSRLSAASEQTESCLIYHRRLPAQ